MTLSETHIDEKDELQLELFFHDIAVAVYISDPITWERRVDLENKDIEVLSIEIRPKCSKSILIASVYRLPDSSKQRL